MQFKIAEALTAAEVARCFPAMRQLRTHFADEKTFLAQVERQRADGYRIAFLEDEVGVRAVAGYRMMESLFAGRFCYVDDLVTDADSRSLGHGGALFDWLVAEARAVGCERLELDSGVQRFAAPRFYLTKGWLFRRITFRSNCNSPDCRAYRESGLAIFPGVICAPGPPLRARGRENASPNCVPRPPAPATKR